MGTLAKVMDDVRLRIKDKNKTEFNDEELLDIVVDVMEQVYKALHDLESNLVIQKGTLPLTAGTDVYTFANSSSILPGGVWITDSDHPLGLSMFHDIDALPNIPEHFVILPSGEMQFFPVPDQDYIVSILYCEPFVAPTLDTMLTYDIPWSGIWNNAITRTAVVECLTILERTVGIAAIHAGDAWDAATMSTYTHGRVRRVMRGRLFYGI